MNKLPRSTVIVRTKAASRRLGCARKQRGVALAMVVWFLAAMSLLVSGIVSQARVDTQLAQVHVARAKAVAAGDGAINLFLADFTALERSARKSAAPVSGEYRVGEHQVRVELVSTAGLIDLRSAPRKVLVALFAISRGPGAGEAQTMAGNVVKLQPSGLGFGVRRKDKTATIKAIEDLLRADGVNRTELDAVRDLVVVGGGGGRSTDWFAAPAAVRAVLAAADPQKAASSEADGSGDGNNNSRSRSSASGGGFRIDAYVRYGDQTWLRRRWATLRSGKGQVPWRFQRTESPRVVRAG